MAAIKKAQRISGHKLVLRDAQPTDAEFIFGLLHDPTRNRYLSAISSTVADQHDWLTRYAAGLDQAYFIMESLDAEPYGAVRLYDARGDSFCWGSWIIRPGAPSHVAIESALMVYSYALKLGFRAAHFEVSRDNETVWRFHEKFGALRCEEREDQYVYRIDYPMILNSLRRYQKFLPAGIQVIFGNWP